MTPVVKGNFENVAPVVKSVVSEIGMSQRNLYEFTCQNKQKIGNKVYVCIPAELLVVDTRFQRTEESSTSKIRKLANNWDNNMMDALKVSEHPEANEFSILDGYHRFTAGTMNGFSAFPCEIVQGLSINPEERLIQEATIFATQTDEVDSLTPMMKHKANVVRGVKANVSLQKLVEKHGINLKPATSRGRTKIGYLAGFSQALQIVKTNNGEEKLDHIFDIICQAKWNLSKQGFSANVLAALNNILTLHEENYDYVYINYFRDIEPEKFFAEAKVAYPERKDKEALTLLLEDKVCAAGAKRVYYGGSVRKLA